MLSSCLISLPSNLQCFIFGPFVNPTRNIHRYKTRLSSRMIYAIPKARANNGTFNIGFQGAKVWNDISDDIKLPSLKRFKKKLKSILMLININCRFINSICFSGFPLFNTGILSFLLLSFFFYCVLCSCLWCVVPDPLI